jgi:hypothetical protein
MRGGSSPVSPEIALVKPLLPLTALGVAAFFLAANALGDEPDADSFLNSGVTAHRGNSGEYPENTIPAFKSGIEIGADWVELDIFRTKDGRLVVIHDRTTERVGDKNLVVPESTYEQLLTVDVATDFRQRHGKTIEAVPKQTIPLLEEVLRLVMTQAKTRVSIQPKMDCVADAIDLVRELGAEAWVGFNDGNLQYMAEVKRLAPGIPVYDKTKMELPERLRELLRDGLPEASGLTVRLAAFGLRIIRKLRPNYERSPP